MASSTSSSSPGGNSAASPPCSPSPSPSSFSSSAAASSAAVDPFASFADPRSVTRRLVVPALRVPLHHLGTVQPAVRKARVQLSAPRTKTVIASKDIPDNERLVLLAEGTSESELPASVQQLISSGDVTVLEHSLLQDYKSLTTDELMQMILPPGIEPITSFEAVGHIAHMNLKDYHLPYKHVIGEVIILKNSNIKTVVNKLGNIHATFRTFDMEVIAGKDDLEAEVSEHGCRFRMNYPEVYWNSRLSTEHRRKVDALKKGEVVCDMFAGIGPFAIPAAKAGFTVYANDLNPRSTYWMNENKKLNKIGDNLEISTMDGRDFVRFLVREKRAHFDHVFMNLPASAEMFLDVFVGLFPRSFAPLPTIHCYGFAPLPDPISDFRARVEEVIGCPLPCDANVYEVRNVSPQKHMICAVFALPEAIAFEGAAPTSAGVGEKRAASGELEDDALRKRASR